MILVTGANGVVGRPLVLKLAELNTNYLSVSRKQLENHLQWDLGSDLNAEQRAGLIGCTELLHCAPIWLLPRHLPVLYDRGVRRVVAFSSTSVISKRESSSPEEQCLVSRLSEAESDLKRFCSEHEVQLTILRPSMIYGYGQDQNVSHIARFIKRRGFMVLIGGAYGLRQPVHADDLVFAMLAVRDNRACFGKTYNLAGAEALTYREMVKRIFSGLNRRAKFILVPLWFLRIALRAARWFKVFDYTPEMADRMNQDLSYSNEAAEKDFSYHPQAFLVNPNRDLP